jgi:hypothetical protein
MIWLAVAAAWLAMAIWWLAVAIWWLAGGSGGVVFAVRSFVFSKLLGSPMYFLFFGIFARSQWGGFGVRAAAERPSGRSERDAARVSLGQDASNSFRRNLAF